MSLEAEPLPLQRVDAAAEALCTCVAPFLRAPERQRTIFLVTFAAACTPLLAGVVLFGWRALAVAGISILSCGLIERLCYGVTRVPALSGRSHAYLTGLLLALTLPPFVPWYVPVVAAAFAIIVGKAVFGGVGHFLWQPALVGRLAVAVLFPVIMNNPTPDKPENLGWGPILAQSKLVVGDVTVNGRVPEYRQWRYTEPPEGKDAFLLRPPSAILAGLTNARDPAFSALAFVPADVPQARPAALMKLPPINDLLYGGRPGGIGETCAIVIIVAGLYLVYRNYVKWQLPLSFLAAAACVVAVGPVQLARANDTVLSVWWPVLSEGPDVGFIYICCQLLSGETMLAAFFLATEMTSRPVTTGGQVIFGLGCGAIAMLLRLYLEAPIPSYMAVLAMNTFVPTIDTLWRPRVLGRPFFWRWRRHD